MPLFSRLRVLLLALVLLVGTGLVAGCTQDEARTNSATAPDTTQTTSESDSAGLADNPPELNSDVPFVETPSRVVEKMLDLAEVDENDVVYDLGSGDGRIVIAAARDHGARGVGIEIKPNLVEEARQNAADAGVSDRVEFRQGDLFDADIGEATVVTLYLLPSVNLDLRPKLFRELSPGTRIVSHDFDMEEWEPDTTWEADGERVFRWTIPEETPSFVNPEEGE